jgi:hypothetical protein
MTNSKKRFYVGQIVTYNRGFEAGYEESDLQVRLLEDVSTEYDIEAYNIEVIEDGRKFAGVDIDCLS